MKTRFLTAVLAGVITVSTALGCAGQGSVPNSAVQLTPTQGALTCGDSSESCTFGNRRFVLVGHGGTLHCSTDGSDFEAVYMPVTAFIRSVTFADGRFVVVGGSYVGRRSVILTSENGRFWTLCRSPAKEVLHAVTRGDGRFVAVGDAGVIFTSRDGRIWKQEFSGTATTLAAVAFGKDVFVAGGDDGLLLVSFDGKRWLPEKSGTHSRINRIAFQGDGFHAISNAIRLRSNDGMAWLPE